MPALIQMHYNELRDRRVKGKDALVMGRWYLICHVPLDNPYTGGVDPCCRERKIIDLQLLSHNDIYVVGKEASYRNDESVARMIADNTLSEKVWMFRIEEEPLRDGTEYARWDHCATYVPEEGDPYNYVLDLKALRDEGIDVVRATSEPYVMSEELQRERLAEAEWEREYY